MVLFYTIKVIDFVPLGVGRGAWQMVWTESLSHPLSPLLLLPSSA